MQRKSLFLVTWLDAEYRPPRYRNERIAALLVKCRHGFALVPKHIELIGSHMGNGNPIGRSGLFLPQGIDQLRSEEHTSELQSRENLVCRPLLDNKKC